jgi:D-alanine-D-alanine ligase
MPLNAHPSELPVLILFNMDLAWKPEERHESCSLATRLDLAMAELGHVTTLLPVTGDGLSSVLSGFSPEEHIVFNWCESIPGIPHSEHLVSECLEEMSFVFTGADSDALRLNQDKNRVKRILRDAGIPTPEWQVFESPERAMNGAFRLRFPVIVKAVHEHCSEGITRDSVVLCQEDLAKRIADVVATYRQPAVVEEFIDGREFHVSLWGNEVVEMLPPVEMDFSGFPDLRDRLCTYDSKFVPGSRHYEGIQTLLPAPLMPDEAQRLEEVCRAAYRVTGCRDYARIDIRMRDGIFYVLDVNPNADLSPDASLACAAETVGFSYGMTGSRIVRYAASRHPLFGSVAL